MPELTITPAQTPLPNGTGNANATGATDATRSAEGGKADSGNGAEAPFATVLKGRMDKNEQAQESSDSAEAAATPTDTASISVRLDISALLPLMGTNPAVPAEVAATPALIADQVAAATDAVLPALPSVQPLAIAAATPAPVRPATTMASAAPVTKGESRQVQASEQDPAFVAAAAGKGGEAAQSAGKIVLDAANTADGGQKHAAASQADLTPTDFRAAMERAVGMTPVAADSVGKAAANQGLRIDTPLGQNGWHEEMGQKLTWMAGAGRQQAELVLTPPQLGRIEVSLTVNGDQATAIFTSPHAAVREALENSMDRLRGVLAEAGVTLGQTQVGSESPNQSQRKGDADFGVAEGLRYASTVALPGVSAIAATGGGRGMIDIFA